jgi:hypothetical protein
MDAPVPSAPSPSPTAPATEGLALVVALVACVVGGLAAVGTGSPGAAALMLVLAGACFAALYARGHLAQR